MSMKKLKWSLKTNTETDKRLSNQDNKKENVFFSDYSIKPLSRIEQNNCYRDIWRHCDVLQLPV